jgi:hypothetical protein
MIEANDLFGIVEQFRLQGAGKYVNTSMEVSSGAITS